MITNTSIKCDWKHIYIIILKNPTMILVMPHLLVAILGDCMLPIFDVINNILIVYNVILICLWLRFKYCHLKNKWPISIKHNLCCYFIPLLIYDWFIKRSAASEHVFIVHISDAGINIIYSKINVFMIDYLWFTLGVIYG